MVAEFDEAINLAKRSLLSWSRGAKLYIDLPVPPTVRKVYKPGVVADRFIERDNLADGVRALYTSVSPGQVVKLCAGTACGKSTRVPCMLAQEFQAVGLVVLPDRGLVRALYYYVRDHLAPKEFPGLSVKTAINYLDVCAVRAPAVLYTSGADFLSIMATSMSKCLDSALTYVFVDEAHEPIPEYYVIRLLVGNTDLGKMKVFMGSATSTEQNMESRGSANTLTVRSVKKEYMDASRVGMCGGQSPLNHININSRTIVFCEDAYQCEQLRAYYASHGVPAHTYHAMTERNKLYKLQQELSAIRPMVVLTTQILQTGYTLSVDTVIDLGYAQDLLPQDNNTSLGLVRRKEFAYERTQRCGRAGRLSKGVAYHVDAQPSEETYDVLPGMEVYVYLWCLLFGFDYDVPMIRQQKAEWGQLSTRAAQFLLSAKAPVQFLIPFIALDGSAKGDSAQVMSRFNAINGPQLVASRHYTRDCVLDWPSMSFAAVPWNDGSTLEFRAPMRVADEWLPMYYLMCAATAGRTGIQYEDLDDTVSEYSVVPGPSDYSDRKMQRRLSEYSRRNSGDASGVAQVYHRPPEYTETPHSPRRGTYVSDVAEKRNSGLSRRMTEATVAPRPRLNKENLRINSAQAEQYKAEVGRRSEGVDRSPVLGTNSPKGNTHRTKNDKWRKYMSLDRLQSEVVMPYNDDLYDLYQQRTSMVSEHDYEVFWDMHYGRLTIANCSATAADKHYISVIRVWNGTTSQLIQSRMQRKPLLSLMDKTREHVKIRDACIDLFNVYIHRSTRYSLAVDARTVQSPNGGPADRFSGTARYTVDAASDTLRHALSLVFTVLTKVYKDDECSGVCLEGEMATYAVAHTILDSNGTSSDLQLVRQPVYRLVHDTKLDYLQLVHDRRPVADRRVNFRQPVAGEFVLMVTLGQTDERVVLGPYHVFDVAGQWCYGADTDQAVSGSPLVSVNDGCVVGMHRGFHGEVDGALVNYFVSTEYFF